MLVFWLPAAVAYVALPLLQLTKRARQRHFAKGAVFALVGYTGPILLIYAMSWATEYLQLNFGVMLLGTPIAFGLMSIAIYQVAQRA
jgi:hypothetical protein